MLFWEEARAEGVSLYHIILRSLVRASSLG